MKYTIAQLQATKSLKDIKGKLRTGSTDSVKYKRVEVADDDRFPEAIIATYGSDSPVVINESGKIDQFLHRGC